MAQEEGVPNMDTVSDVMRRDVVTVTASTPIGEVVRIFRERGISGTPVVDDTACARTSLYVSAWSQML